ncbi:MAG: response regulator, partial [Hylemonella sp.]|nr:response regulator [Hylemonella sp.]
LLGIQCDLAVDGREALAMWMRERYALVISDIHMPHMDGYQLAGAIRLEEAKSGRARTPVLALTANILKGEVERCKAAGMDDYLAKPASLPVLQAAIARFLPSGEVSHASTATAPALPTGATPASTPQASALPLFDTGMLTRMLGDNPSLHQRLMLKFLGNAEVQAAQITSAVAAGEALTAGKTAHTLKSGARTVGAMQLGALAERLEHAGKAADLPLCQQLLAQLPALLASTRDRMESDPRLQG